VIIGVAVCILALGLFLFFLKRKGRVVCEACGRRFEPTKGYYEPGEYAYCSDCCHW
jgi:hypothetical protein